MIMVLNNYLKLSGNTYVFSVLAISVVVATALYVIDKATVPWVTGTKTERKKVIK